MSTKNEFRQADNLDQINKYIDEICSNPDYLCKNQELCGTSTSIYSSINDVNSICDQLGKNQCENDITLCNVSTQNTFTDPNQNVVTSFNNIILPIPDAKDNLGNQFFLRLPALSPSKLENSNQPCSICACVERFATTLGLGANTAPGQNQCVYMKTFNSIYYPIDMELFNKNNGIDSVSTAGYTIFNSNIIETYTDDDLQVGVLYDKLVSVGIAESIVRDFVVTTLYNNDQSIIKELQLYIANKGVQTIKMDNKNKFYQNISFYYFVFCVFVVFLFFV
jgi:hypothetical protein